MKKPALLIAIVSLLTPSQLPASSKPCRDKDGRVITCPKERKPSPRCKDAQGRFVACAPPRAETPKKS
jgi:hypothetical protein